MISLPGIGGSGETHWQSQWERAEPAAFRRFRPQSWDAPVLADWVEALQRSVSACAEPPVLVAHSLGCLLVAHWAASTRVPIAGAFLVCVPDPNGDAFPEAARSFRPVPTAALPFPSLIVSSNDDPYGTVAYARQRAAEWRSGHVVAGALGHINAASGIGGWNEGRGLLDAFLAGLSSTASRHREPPNAPSSGAPA